MTNPLSAFDDLFGTSDEELPEAPAFEPDPASPPGTPSGSETAPGIDDFNPFEAPTGSGVSGGTPGALGLDVDLTFAISMLHGGRSAVRQAVAAGVTPDRLEGTAKDLFTFTLEHLGQYGSTPTVDQVLARLALVLPDSPPEGPPEFWAREILNRDLHVDLQRRLEGWTGQLEKRRPMDAFEEIREWVRQRSLVYSRITLEPLHTHVAAVKDRYLRRKAGERGIQTPWPTLNNLTYGMYPEQVWMIVARSGVGKTWSALALAHGAWEAGERVLFATTEMSQIAVVQRFVAIHLKLPYEKFNQGKLPAFIEEKFLTACDELFKDERIQLVGGDFDFEPESYEAAIEKMQPTLSVLDGAYLLRGKGKTRFDQAAEAFNEVQRIGKRQKVAQLLTSQFNREAKSEDAKSGSQEKVALSDAAVWNATAIFALAQTKDMRRDRIAQGKLLKNREGPLGDVMTLNWDFEAMDFTEQMPVPESDDFGTGVEGPAPPLANDPFAATTGGPVASDDPVF